MLSSSSMSLAVGAIVGKTLASNAGWATLPVALMMVGTALASIPAARLMQHLGRRIGFAIGATLGLIGNLIAAIAIFHESFILFSVGLFLIGIYQGFGNFYRFAAAEVVDITHAGRAISLVVSGGLLAAFLGPQLAEFGRALVSSRIYMGSYLIQAVLAITAIIALLFILIPTHPRQNTKRRTVSTSKILIRPNMLVAIAGGAISYSVMSTLMITTPLAMIDGGHAHSSVTPVIQWHIIGMFAPSFFTGPLIRRWGASKIMIAGFSLILLNIAISVSGNHFWTFFSALLLLGVGWNFAFIGATALLTQSTKSHHLSRVQSANEFLVFGLTAAAGLSAGWLFNAFGWATLNFLILPVIVLALLIVSAFELYRKRSSLIKG
nr:MFS transporter [Pseudomonas citronellolis]